METQESEIAETQESEIAETQESEMAVEENSCSCYNLLAIFCISELEKDYV